MTQLRRNTRVEIVGLGHVGLPLAALSAAAGYDVHGVDKDEGKIREISGGTGRWPETGLTELLHDEINRGRLQVSSQHGPADIFVICVPTPLTPQRRADLSHVRDVARGIAPHLTSESLVLLESTVPCGSTKDLSGFLATLRPDLGPDRGGICSVAYCPERCLPGQALSELRNVGRVIGGIDAVSAHRASEFYQHVLGVHNELTDPETAEMVKLAENSARDVQIAFANELGELCRRLSVDPMQVINIANQHPRVDILNPGTGVGGHCLPVDPWFLAQSASNEATMITAARQVYDRQPSRVVGVIEKTISPFRKPGRKSRIALLGLSFKPDVADLRNSPAVAIARRLANHQRHEILVAEPHIAALPEELQGLGLSLHSTALALQSSDFVALLVAHKEFLPLAPQICARHTCLDFCNFFHTAQSAGVHAAELGSIDHKSTETPA